jgi:DNA-binding transcriptional ArsR family regulator
MGQVVSDGVATRAKRAKKAPIVLRDAQAIKALTHPARLAVLDDLFAGRELTATEAARIAGVTPSAMSYHLRELEKAGIVERVENAGDGRERPWRASGARLQVEAENSPVGSAATALLAQEFVNRIGRDLAVWSARRLDEPDKRWRDVGGAAVSTLWLTVDEAEEIMNTLQDLADRARGRTADRRPEGSRRVRVASILVPRGEV